MAEGTQSNDPSALPGAALLGLAEATDGESLWRAGVAALRATMPAFHYLMAVSTEGMQPFLLRTTLPVPDEPDYWDRLARVAPLEQLVKRHRGRLVGRMSDDVPFFVLRLTPFYRKFVKPEGWRYSAAMFFWEDDGRFLGHFAQNRTREQGDFTDAEMATLRALHPYFHAALRRVILLDQERAGRAAIETTLQRAPLALAVLDWDLRPTYHNPAAAEICAAGGDTPRAVRARFAPPAGALAACRRLRACYEAASLDGRRRGFARVETLADASGGRLRVRLVEVEGARTARPHFVVEFLAGPGAESSHLELLACLTPAERAVALAVARGLENQAIAAELGVSRHTVRAHLRQIFEKLDVTTRTALAVRLATAPASAAE